MTVVVEDDEVRVGPRREPALVRKSQQPGHVAGEDREDDGEFVAAASGLPMIRAYFVPRDRVEFLDNWDVMVEASRPPLSSIDMNLSALGREAGARLIAMMAGEKSSGIRRLPCTLVPRRSSTP